MYGGENSQCVCCGERESIFLAIDHIYNNGAEERKKLKNVGITGGAAFYFWLRKNGYPKGYQVLCYNCNIGKYRCGECPHKTK